ncbi:MAG TPA: peptidylprolyl isomerase [Chitinophagaceae bacterium]|nr:peptidylprolyl isomerase [Chitinophagaceae bacterium]
MRNKFLVILMMFAAPALAQQTVTEKFQKINTTQEAQAFVDANQTLKPEILKLTLGKDTTLIDKRLLRQKKGDVFSVGYVTYKVIDATESVAYRAHYIFLDGSSLTPAQVDSMKKIILQKANAGATWDQLSDQYTMDGNKTHGDTGWFFGPEMLPKEFQDAVQDHKLNEIFFVDVADKQWHYIVKKTYDDNRKKEITVLKANGR